MSEQTNGFDQNGRGASPTEVDIPILKKKEKERKGAGLVLPGAVPGGAQVAGGAGLAKAGGLLALLSGKMGLAALALGALGAGAIGFGLSQQKGAARRSAAPELGALSSSINVDRRNAQGSKSLSYMAKAGAGQLKWEDPTKSKPAAAPEKASDAPADVASAEGAAEGEMPDPTAERPRMANDLSGAKLSSQLGQSGAFGKNNIFAKGTGFNMKTMDNKAKSNLGGSANLAAARRGQVSGKLRGKSNLSAKAINTNKIIAGKSIGQLKFAGHRSQAAMNAGDSGAAATYAADAFDQQTTQGGSLEGTNGIGDGLGTVNPVGSGAPDATGGTGACPSGWSQAEGGGCTPPDLEGVNQTRYQGLVDGAKNMADQAKMLYILAAVLLVAGIALVAAGWGTFGISMIIGLLLIALAVALFVMARQMGNQAKQMGQMIDSMYGQKDQGKIIERAGDDAQGGEDSTHLEERADRIEENVNEDRLDEGYGDETYRE